jgi:hypothetical protein
MIARWLFLFGFAAALLISLGCSSGGDDGSNPPALACTDGGAAAANGVTMNCAGAVDSTTEQVDVVMSGPATGTTALRGFNFDVPYDPTKLEFVPAGTYASPLIPNALILVSLEDGLPGRVVVSVQAPGADPDILVTPGPHTVITLSFKTVTGVSVAPTPLTFENEETTPTTTGVTFSSGLTLSYQ